MESPAADAMPICFDLDGTLGSFGGGYVLLRQALGELWGEPPSAEELRGCTGSTDWEIVDELHLARFGRRLEEPGYEAYQEGCLRRFVAAFPESAPAHRAFPGVLGALGTLHGAGARAAVVSGNAPRVLDFKLRILGLDASLPRVGSLPRQDRPALLVRSLDGCPGPHLYVGDRRHDLEAARSAGIPFLAIGELVPEAEVSLSADAPSEEVLAWIRRLAAPLPI